jgi:hypothetical protein
MWTGQRGAVGVMRSRATGRIVKIDSSADVGVLRVHWTLHMLVFRGDLCAQELLFGVFALALGHDCFRVPYWLKVVLVESRTG